jgi:hypothetical protein
MQVPDSGGAPPRPSRPNRRRDLAGWLLTPLLTVVTAPALAFAVGVALLVAPSTGSPPMCDSVRAENGCEEATLAMWGAHGVVFAVLWLLLWLLPWWRSLRVPRNLLAVVATLVLVLVPIRMAR